MSKDLKERMSISREDESKGEKKLKKVFSKNSKKEEKSFKKILKSPQLENASNNKPSSVEESILSGIRK